jgi:ferric-dicitrate binding protein FerR (iron transport regulator)
MSHHHKRSASTKQRAQPNRLGLGRRRRRRCCRANLALVARALVLVAADLLVLALALLHERGELGVVVLGDGTRCHLDLAVAAGFCDARLDVLDGLLERGDADGLVEALRGEDCEMSV